MCTFLGLIILISEEKEKEISIGKRKRGSPEEFSIKDTFTEVLFLF